MKYVIFPEAGKVAIAEKSVPEVTSETVLIKVKACGLCGTDLLSFRGLFPVSYPYSPGHEFSGEVVEVGKNVKTIAAGDRVVVNPNYDCGTCYYCKRGYSHLCENQKQPGVKSNGGFAQYCLVAAKMVHRIPQGLPFINATLAEPLSCCVHIVDEAHIQKGECVLIIGGGTMGLMCVELCKNSHTSTIIVSEPMAFKREAARRLGAHVTCDPTTEDIVAVVKQIESHGADVVIDNVARPQTIRTAVEALRRKGRLIIAGLGEHSDMPVAPADVTENEIEIKGAFLNPHTFPQAIELLQTTQIRPEEYITHTMSLQDIAEAMELAASGQAIKVVLVIDA